MTNVHIYKNHINSVKTQLTRDVNKYGNCQLAISNSAKKSIKNYNLNKISLDDLFKSFKISDFNLEGYDSYGILKEEMLSRTI